MTSAVWVLVAPVTIGAVQNPDPRPLIGINYFSGWWAGAGDKWFDPTNASLDWRPLYPDRLPLLGEYNTQSTMDSEITTAADAGVDFFQILWYDNFPSERAPNARLLNRGVAQFMSSPNAHRMKFFIEWCNAYPLFVVHNDSEWARMVHEVWIPAMSHPSYLRVGGALVFKVISAGSFLKYDCQTNRTIVESRWQMFRNAARAAGLGELLIGAGMTQDDMTAAAYWGGPQYNWTGMYCALDHDDPSYTGQVLPWSNESEFVAQNRVAHAAAHGVPFVPVVVSGWDPRPWHEQRASFTFPTATEWMAELETVKAQLGFDGVKNLGFPLPGGHLAPAFNIYAWNEFAEGGIMAPSKGWNSTRLETLKVVFGKPTF